MKWLMLAGLALLAGCNDPAAVPTAEAAPTAPPVEVAMADRNWNVTLEQAGNDENLLIAAAKHVRDDTFPDGSARITDVVKAPWKFYGQRLCFDAVVSQVADIPPGSLNSIGYAGEIGEVIAVSGDTIIDMVVVGGSGTIQPDNRLKMCGLVTGRSEVANRVGGTFQHLMMVGKLK